MITSRLTAVLLVTCAAAAAAQPPAPVTARLIYRPALTAPGPDVSAQTTAILAALDGQLASAGSNLAHVVSASVVLRDAADFGPLNAAWTKAWPTAPPTRTTVVAGLRPPDARVQVSVVAVPVGAERRVIHPAGWAPPAGPFSYAIRTADTVFLSGLVARRGADNTIVAGDITAQTTAILENAKTVLAAAGLTLADAVNARLHITDTVHFPAMNAAYRPFFPSSPPSRATVRSALVNPADLVEITLTAVAGTAKRAVTTPAADGTPGQPNPNLSSAIEAGTRLYLAGMLGNTPATAGNAAAQAAETLARLERTMTLAGYSWSNVREASVWVTDLAAADAVLAALKARAAGATPAVTLVGAGLMSPEGLVEIMLTADK